MKVSVSIFMFLQILLSQYAAAEPRQQSNSIEIIVNETTLSCSHGDLRITATSVSDIVNGNYPESVFRSGSVDHACFFRNYILDKASQSNGILVGDLRISTFERKDAIYHCDPPPCDFCEAGECTFIRYDTYIEESVYIDILGLVFSATSKLKGK